MARTPYATVDELVPFLPEERQVQFSSTGTVKDSAVLLACLVTASELVDVYVQGGGWDRAQTDEATVATLAPLTCVIARKVLEERLSYQRQGQDSIYEAVLSTLEKLRDREWSLPSTAALRPATEPQTGTEAQFWTDDVVIGAGGCL